MIKITTAKIKTTIIVPVQTPALKMPPIASHPESREAAIKKTGTINKDLTFIKREIN